MPKTVQNSYIKAYCDRGVLKSDLKDDNGAIKDYSKAIELSPKFERAYLYRGISEYSIGDKMVLVWTGIKRLS